MTLITIPGKKASDIMEIVRELREYGWRQGTDFDFKYYPYLFEASSGIEYTRHTVFTFYNDKYATFFALKWA